MRNIARRIIKAISNEWPLKILAILLALALWAYVVPREKIQEKKTLAVQAVYTSTELTVTNIEPSEVEVIFEGRRRAMAAADLGSVRIIAEIGDRKTGEHSSRLEPRGVPPGVDVSLGIYTVRVTLDRKDSIRRPVRVETLGKQAEGFRLGTLTVNPRQVTIEGASSALRDVAYVVAVVDISGFNSTVEQDVAVELRDDRNVSITDLQCKPPTVQVVVPVTKVATKTVPIKPQFSDPPDGYQVATVQTSPNTVTIAGEERITENIEYISTVRIEISNLRGQGTFTPSLIFPEGIKSMGVGAATVTVTTERVALPSPPEQPQPEEDEAEPESSAAPETGLAPDKETGPQAGSEETTEE